MDEEERQQPSGLSNYCYIPLVTTLLLLDSLLGVSIPPSLSLHFTIMMLVQLPAMDSVQGLSLADSLPSLSSLPGPFTVISHLAKPSVLLTLLATLVILSSIRAAFLFMRLPQQKGSVSLVQSVVVETDKVVADMISTGPSCTSGVVKGKQAEKPTIAVPASAAATMTTMDKKTTSWFWNLLKWDSLPALPTSVRNRINGVSMSETEPSWQPQQRGRRPGPAFEHPCTFDMIFAYRVISYQLSYDIVPALYQSDVPVSMAKMIMSRHVRLLSHLLIPIPSVLHNHFEKVKPYTDHI